MHGLVIASANASELVASAAAAAVIAGAIAGLLFRGAAAAWKTERDAAVDKANRLGETVMTQAAQILTLQGKVEVLEKRTDYEAHAERVSREHAQQLNALSELNRGLHANTTAIEFLIKQAFPNAAVPFSRPEGDTA